MTTLDAQLETINNDQELLDELRLSETKAAGYLSRARQTLNTMLRQRGDQNQPPNDYFRLSDIYILVSAAHRSGVDFGREKIVDYIQRTRGGKAGQTDYQQVMALLQPSSELIKADIYAVIYILPAFSEMKAEMPRHHQSLREEIQSLQSAPQDIELFCVSTTDMIAQLTGNSLGIKDKERCVGSHIVDHYQPMALYYLRSEEHPRAKIFTQYAGLIDAPHYRTHMIRLCVEGLLRDNQRETLANACGAASGQGATPSNAQPA